MSESKPTEKKKWFFVLEKEIDNSDAEEFDYDGESLLDYCSRETDFCRDSSDSSYDETTFDVDVEYEVASETETESQFDGSSSGTDEHFDRFDITTIICGTSTDFADSSDSYDSQDSELSPADFWRCIKCNNQQNNPLFRYCEKCYQIKKTHFPPPPKMRKRRHHNSGGISRRYYRTGPNATTSSLLSNGNNCNFSLSHNLDIRKTNINDNLITRKDFFTNQDKDVNQVQKRKKNSIGRGISKRARNNSYSECSEIEITPTDSQSRQAIARGNEGEKDDDTVSLADTVIEELSEGEIAALKDEGEISELLEIQQIINRRDPKALIQSFSCIETTNIIDNSPNDSLPILAKNSTVSSDSSNSSSGSCIFCLAEPKNAVFVHSKFVHLCSCYKCAVKIFNKNKRCPICNCAVKTVLQVFAH